MAAKLNLDKLDLQIIHEMMDDAGISYADLGKKLFVSGGTIHVRIKKLQEIGIVRGTKLNVDLKLLGYDITAFVGIYLEKSSLYDQVAEDLKKVPEIIRINYTTGNYSMFIEIVARHQPTAPCPARPAPEDPRHRTHGDPDIPRGKPQPECPGDRLMMIRHDT
jgi:Lrp/AsnC family transcriptional regulator for asnA, asnC and gidA